MKFTVKVTFVLGSTEGGATSTPVTTTGLRTTRVAFCELTVPAVLLTSRRYSPASASFTFATEQMLPTEDPPVAPGTGTHAAAGVERKYHWNRVSLVTTRLPLKIAVWPGISVWDSGWDKITGTGMTLSTHGARSSSKVPPA